MRALFRLFVAILFVAVIMLGALAMIDNQDRVALKFLEWQTPELSIYWWLFLALALGFLLGWSLAGVANLRRRAMVRQTRT